MKFHEYLNQYIETLECSAKELADSCDLSAAVISRYRTGEREPTTDSEHLEKLILGLAKLAKEKSLPNLSEARIREEFHNSLNRKDSEYETFLTNFNTLISELNINMKALAQTSNFDVSYLYRVHSGQRHPSDLDTFSTLVCQYIISHHNSDADIEKLTALLGAPKSPQESDDQYVLRLKSWLFTNVDTQTEADMKSFLEKLDAFNLDEYIRSIHFDELKVPSIPFQIYSPRSYYGVEEMRKGELDFFKHTVLSKSQEPIFMCSDMPMSDMAEDMDFNRKWMFAIAMSLKKGLHLNIIHNVDRPFHEMMLGLESWIPIYMTGQISPYHLPNVSTDVYHHFNYVSGTVALTGECINGHHDRGKYYLTNNKEEVAYYKQKAADLLSKAQPLMEIFRAETKRQFVDYQKKESIEGGKRHNLLSSPPIATLPADLLTQILDHLTLTPQDRERILAHAGEQRKLLEQTLENSSVCDEFATISPKEFAAHPVHLSLADAFVEADIPYTYDEYLAHIRATRDFAQMHSGYTVHTNSTQAFRNIQIHIIEGKCVRLSKTKTPVIHFVIRHPKMVSALEHFIAPVVE